jgi:methylthioribose-1-phosphate isomerase
MARTEGKSKEEGVGLLRTVAWKDGAVVLIDQTKLPDRLVYVRLNDYKEVAKAIKTMIVRGAPAIGVAAAFGLSLAAIQSKSKTLTGLIAELDKASEILRSTRPTAVNLFWALERVMKRARNQKSIASVKSSVLDEALKMSEEDIQVNKRIGLRGAAMVEDGDVILTHCNAGSLATVAYGTALGVVRAAREAGKHVSVIATETRPVMQGSRLTAFELQHDGIDVSLIPDTAVGHTISRKMIKLVIVGADRVLRTGHVFNKIGTYQVAALANLHNIPFYVAAPVSTFDLQSDPSDIAIEERPEDEVTKVAGTRIVPAGVRIFNPAFDLTPPELISGIITEKGVLRPPFQENIKTLLG